MCALSTTQTIQLCDLFGLPRGRDKQMGKSVKQYMTDTPDLRAALGVAPLNDQQNPDSSPPRPTTASTISFISTRPPSAAALAAAADCIGPYTGIGPYAVVTGSRARPSPPRRPLYPSTPS